MTRLVLVALGVVGCSLPTGCFKLNPEFVESGGSESGGSGPESSRVDEGLKVLFVFDDQACQPGKVVPVVGDEDLLRGNDECTPCTAQGLQIGECAALVSSRNPMDLGSSDAFTLEAWVSMDATDVGQRMLELGDEFVLSVDPSRSVLLLHESTRVIMGSRPSDDTGPWHLAVTHDGLDTQLFIDDEQVGEPRAFDLPPLGPGSLTIAGKDHREWTGTVHLLAVYDRALDIDEYLVNHEAGPTATGGS